VTINTLGDASGASLPAHVIYATSSAVPEPPTELLLLMGVGLLWTYRRRTSANARKGVKVKSVYPKAIKGSVCVFLKRAACAVVALLACTTGAVAVEDVVGAMSTSPAMSPDQRDIVFSSNTTGHTNLWIIGADGQSLRNLTSGLAIDDEPAWSPDGQVIAFSRRQNNVRDVWTIRRDGSQIRQLTAKVLNNFHPTWSPDGTRIAFVSDRAGSYDIWIMNADGTNQTRVTSLPGQENDPSFSPSGTELVFSEAVNGNSSLFIVTLATGAIRMVTNTGFNDWHPSWSPLGIIFSSDRPPTTASGNKTIWMVQSNGAGLRQFANVMAIDPTWTPNGNVVFTDEANPGPAASAGVSVFNVTARTLQPLLPASFSGDLNGDGIIDLRDLTIIQQAIGLSPNRPYDARDRNGDGKIDALDVRLLTTVCTFERCASNPSP
jgi:Tol biopolymer transport system component